MSRMSKLSSNIVPTLLAITCVIWLLGSWNISLKIIQSVMTHSNAIWIGGAIGAVGTLFTYQTMLHTFIHETSHLMMSVALGHKVTEFNVSKKGGYVNFNAHSSRFFWLVALAPYLFMVRMPALLFVLAVLLVDNPLSQANYCMALGALLSHSFIIIYKEMKISIQNHGYSNGNDFKHLGIAKSTTLIVLLNMVMFITLLAWLLSSIGIADINSQVLHNLIDIVKYATGFF